MPSHINSQTAITGKTALLLGAGYVACHLAPALLARGYQVLGTTRSPEHAEAIKKGGITPLITEDLRDSELKKAFKKADLILSSISVSYTHLRAHET